MDLFWLLHGSVKVVSCISRLPNKTKLKFDQDFNACWSLCFELKVLNESKYSMPWLRCSFANALFFQHVYPHLCWTVIVVWQLYVSRFKRTGAPITGDPQNRSQSVFPPNLEILRSRSESVLSPIAMCSWGQTAQWGQNITMTWSLLWLSQRQ